MAKKTKGQKIRKAVIPVAGFGTRFLPATIAQPKEMLTVVDKPVIQYIVEEMVAAGIEEIVFVTGRNKRAIEDHFDYSPELEQSLRESKKTKLLREVHRISKLAKFVYVRQNKTRGNGDALLMAKEVIGNEPFAFSYGDDIIEHRTPAIKQLISVYQRTHATVIGTLQTTPDVAHRYGILKPRGKIRGKTFRISGIVEKPTGVPPSLHFSPGRYVFTPDIFEHLERTQPGHGREVLIVDAVTRMLRRKPVYAHEMLGKYFDCGNKVEYVKANIHFALKHRDLKNEIRSFIHQPA